MSKKLLALQEKLRQFALSFPEAHEDHPWGHIAVKVRKKAFVFLSGQELSDGKLSMTIKLPISGEMVLGLPYMEKAGYGLGKSGWVTMRLGARDPVDRGMFESWIDQSYRAVAPKKLSKQLEPLAT